MNEFQDFTEKTYLEKTTNRRAGETPQARKHWLPLQADLGFIPSTYLASHHHLQLQFQASSACFWPLWVPAIHVHRCPCRGKQPALDLWAVINAKSNLEEEACVI